MSQVAETWIDRAAAMRLCMAFVADEQERAVRAGRMARSAVRAARLAAATDDAATMGIGEDGLGFDSLARLDLVARLTRWLGLAATGVEDYLLIRPRLGDWADLVAHHFATVGPAAQIAFETSGSSGAPRMVVHDRVTLDAEIAALRAALPERAPSGRVLCAVSPRHLYGFLWGLLLPAAEGRVAIDLHGDAPLRAVRDARAGDLILATPFLWERLAMLGSVLPPGVLGVTSGSAAGPSTWQAAGTLGLEMLLDVYGATETGGIGLRRAADAPFDLLPHLQGDAAGLHRRHDGTEVPLQDHLRWQDGARFRVTGRRDRVLQVAGTNVNPRSVRETVLATGLVRDVAVRLDGERLKAFVVLADDVGQDVAEPQIRAALTRLPAPARPDRFSFGTALPRTATGKLADW
ncbi:4-coumarate--CoA ligase [Roseivivax isoporae]|uniref:4-coumarate--CoA ligase n=1 Tax=Roseivivax isoporae LMG 25204 TaxID=1449351 RepID=X7FB55_9RHOB|nr:4-coumarate--CoA ligase [Roseivivax isoporae]ETX29346.1 hypothetical protein RISW2_01365 [Roseivivax isoporae LMG 25204]